MEVLNRTSEGLKRCYNVLIQPKELEGALELKLKETAKKVRLDGFRPGKVPVSMVKRMFGATVAVESKEDAIKQVASDIIRKENIELATQCATSLVKDDENGLEFSMKFEIMPVLELKPYDNMEVTKHVAEISEAEIKELIEDLRDRKAEWVDDAELTEAACDCKLTVTMTTHTDKFPDPSTSEDVEIEINDDTISRDVEKELVGAKVGETREFSHIIPEELRSDNGTTMFYSVTVNKIQKKKLIESDEDLAKAANFENADDMNKWAKNVLNSKYTSMSSELAYRNVLEKLSDMYDCAVPESLVNIEEHEVLRQIEQEAKRLGKEFTPHIKAECRKIAVQRVRLGLVVAEIAKKESLSVSEHEMINAIKGLSVIYPGIEKEVRNNSFMLRGIAAPILERKVVNLIMDKAKITEEKCSVKELIALDEEEFDFFIDGSDSQQSQDEVKEEAKEPSKNGPKEEPRPKKVSEKKKAASSEKKAETTAETPKKRMSSKKKTAE